MALSKRYLIKLLLISFFGFITSQELKFAKIAAGSSYPHQDGRSNYENIQAQKQTQGVSELPLPLGSVNSKVSDSIALSISKFAHRLGLLMNPNDGTNVDSQAFSPVSLMSALALLMLGAKSSTYQELANLFDLNYDSATFHDQLSLMLEDLQLTNIHEVESRRNKVHWRDTVPRSNIRKPSPKESSSSGDYIVKVANGLFMQNDYSLNLDYKVVVSSIYHSNLKTLNFRQRPDESKAYINDWVEKNTFGKISNIISGDIPNFTNLILSTALYFKGFWENPFFEAATAYDNFFVDGTNEPPKKVKMMATGGSFPYYEDKNFDCRIIGMPYKGNLTTMYIIQPNNSSRSKLASLQKILTPEAIEEMISNMVQVSALVAFPKMKFTQSFDMKLMLQRLGITRIFSNGLSDLSLVGDPKITYNRQYHIEQSIPKAEAKNNLASFDVKDRFNGVPHFFVRFGNEDRQDGFVALASLEEQRKQAQSQARDLYVESILHKVFLDINEFGTEAAAATVALLFRSGTDVLFRADSPFLLLIRHDLTKLPLFYGIINDPLLMS